VACRNGGCRDDGGFRGAGGAVYARSPTPSAPATLVPSGECAVLYSLPLFEMVALTCRALPATAASLVAGKVLLWLAYLVLLSVPANPH
jgi:hypothetical protein